MRKLILTTAILLVSASAHAQVSTSRGLIPLKTTDNAAVLNTKPVEQPKAEKPLSVAEQLQAIGEIKSDVPTKGQVTYLPAKDEARPPVQPTDTKAAESKGSEAKASAAKTPVAKAPEAKPLEAPKPAEIKSVETKPAEVAKPVEAKPADAKPVEAAKPAEAPAAAKAAEAKPVEPVAKPGKAKAKRRTTQASIEGRIRGELRRYGIALSRHGIYW